jgi:hypothetical protein
VAYGKKFDAMRVLRGVDLTGLDLSMATMADNDRKVLRQNGAEVG